MPRSRKVFLTVPSELIEHAEAVAQHFRDHGYRVGVEQFRLEYPFTPTLVGTRRGTTIVVEVDRQPPLRKLAEWARYAASCTRDTRVAVCVPDSAIGGEIVPRLQEMRVGLYVAGDAVREVLPPRDLAVNLQPPDLQALPRRIRQLLGPVYEQLARSQWREAFEEACQVVEVEARRYLKKGNATGRIVVVAQGGIRTLSAGNIDRMTLGQLAIAFANIQTPNRNDTVVAQALAAINPDRVGVAHHKNRKATESRLRRNVGRNFYVIVAALKALQ